MVSTPKSRRVMAAVCLAALVLPLSFSAGAVATPAIGLALGGGPIAQTWITNAFMLAFGSTLMAAGAMADQVGRKRVFVAGIGGFALASLLVGLAPNILWLDLLRGAQGLAAAAALAGGSAALAQECDGAARLRAFSLLGTTFGVGLALGPVLAGVVVAYVGWRMVFVSGAIIGGAALLLGMSALRETRVPQASGLDWPGAASFTAALALFTVAVLQAPEDGWTSPFVLGLLLASAVALAAFVEIERRVSRPMLDLSLFGYPAFVGVQLLPVATCVCYVVLLVLLPLRFIGIEGYGPVAAGLTMSALSAPMLVVPLLAARLVRRWPPAVVSAGGLVVAAAGLLWLARTGIGVPAAALVPPMLLIGTGTGLPWGLMDGLSVSVVPKEKAGMASGIFSTIRVAGEGVALALVLALLAALARTRLDGLGVAGASAHDLATASQGLASGDLAQAARLFPQLSGADLAQVYAGAFGLLLVILAALTAAAAAGLVICLGLDRRRADGSPDPGEPGRLVLSPRPRR